MTGVMDCYLTGGNWRQYSERSVHFQFILPQKDYIVVFDVYFDINGYLEFCSWPLLSQLDPINCSSLAKISKDNKKRLSSSLFDYLIKHSSYSIFSLFRFWWIWNSDTAWKFFDFFYIALLYCKIWSDYLVLKNNKVVYLSNMYLTDWPEWLVQLHSLVEIHVGCQIGDRSMSVVEKGHSTTMWTKVYPILTTPSIGQLWTFYILPSLCLPYTRHYNPRFVYFLPTFWSPKTFFQRAFFLKFWPYVWLVFKSGF